MRIDQLRLALANPIWLVLAVAIAKATFVRVVAALASVPLRRASARQAAFALSQLRDPRAVDDLTTALRDANADVRRQAAFALGQIARRWLST